MSKHPGRSCEVVTHYLALSLLAGMPFLGGIEDQSNKCLLDSCASFFSFRLFQPPLSLCVAVSDSLSLSLQLRSFVLHLSRILRVSHKGENETNMSSSVVRRAICGGT